MKVVDKLRALLLGEMAGAEWEVLEQEEWGTNEVGLDEDAVLVGPRRSKDHAGLVSQSIMSVKTVYGEGGGVEVGRKDEDRGAQQRGTSGWTKLKPRP
jgi:hypothetical protein